LDLRATELCQLCHTWRTKVQSIPGSDDLQSWGPSEQQLLEAAVWKVTASWNEGDGEWQEGTGPGHDANDMPEGPDWEDVVDEDSDFEDSDFELLNHWKPWHLQMSIMEWMLIMWCMNLLIIVPH